MSAARYDDTGVDMNSEYGDIPSDESLSISGSVPMLPSGRASASSIDSIFGGLARDAQLRARYPEFHRQITSMSQSHGVGSNDGPETFPDTSEGLLLRDAFELFKQLRRSERHVSEREKENERLQEQNRQMRETYVKIYAKAEQEEEYISNILLKRIQKLKNDKETLAQKYEQEEEFLTNELMRRIQQLQSERDSLEGKMKTEQGALIDNLLQTIRRLETEMGNSRKNMDKMRKEKIDQENALEHEQEQLFNTLGKKMDQLNDEKRKLQMAVAKACELGFVVEEDLFNPLHSQHSQYSEPMAIPDRPPSASLQSGEVSPSFKITRLHSEMARLRSQLRSKEKTIDDLNLILALKDQQMRAAESDKDKVDRVTGGLNDTIDKLTQLRNILIADKANEMGPPSVPPFYGDTTDMDDASSRGSLDVMN